MIEVEQCMMDGGLASVKEGLQGLGVRLPHEMALSGLVLNTEGDLCSLSPTTREYPMPAAPGSAHAGVDITEEAKAAPACGDVTMLMGDVIMLDSDDMGPTGDVMSPTGEEAAPGVQELER